MKRLRTRIRQLFITLIFLWPKSDLFVWVLATGAGLVVIGQLLHFISAGYLVKKDELITAGPYRFTRNPFYLANFIADIGLTLMTGVPIPAIIYLIVFYLVVIPRRVRKEQAFLGDRFGADYQAYCRMVPCFFPRLLPARMNIRSDGPARIERPQGAFAWSQIIKYRELWRLMRAFGLIIVFYLQYLIRFNPLPTAPAGTDWRLLAQGAVNIVLLIILGLIIIVPPVVEYVRKKNSRTSEHQSIRNLLF